MRILVSYRGIPQSRGWATGDMVVKAFRALGHEVFPYGNYYQTTERIEGLDPETLFQQEYDLVLFMECNDGDPQYTEWNSSGAAKARVLASWLFDTSYYADSMTRFTQAMGFQHNFIANPLEVEKFDNGHFLPYACDRDLHFREAKEHPAREVALVGSVRDDRTALVKAAAQRGVQIELIGGAFREAYVDALADSRVIVNQNPTAGGGLLNMRTFEAPAAGAYLVMERRDFEANEGIFLENKQVGVFDTTEELVALCATLRGYIDLADRTRLAGQEHVLSHHTYENRCQEILRTIFPHEA